MTHTPMPLQSSWVLIQMTNYLLPFYSAQILNGNCNIKGIDNKKRKVGRSSMLMLSSMIENKPLHP